MSRNSNNRVFGVLFSSINLFSIHQLSTVSLGSIAERSGNPSQAGEGDRAAVEVVDSLTFLTVPAYSEKVHGQGNPRQLRTHRHQILKAKETRSMQSYEIRAGRVHLQVVSHQNCLTNISSLSPFSRDPGKFSAPLKITSVFYCWERIPVFTETGFLIFTEADSGIPPKAQKLAGKINENFPLVCLFFLNLLRVYSNYRSRSPSALQINCTFQTSGVGCAMV